MHSVTGVEEGGSPSSAWPTPRRSIANGLDARGAVGVAAERLRQRAARISDPGWRQSFLERVPDNARLLELARLWQGTR